MGNDNNNKKYKCSVCGELVIWVDTIPDEQFWGCGECGSVWFEDDPDLKEWVN